MLSFGNIEGQETNKTASHPPSWMLKKIHDVTTGQNALSLTSNLLTRLMFKKSSWICTYIIPRKLQSASSTLN